jgi:esterase/lipase
MKKIAFVIHGWSTTISNLNPSIDFLKDENFEVYTPYLEGHYSNNPDDFVKPNWKDWLNQCDKEFKSIYNKYDEFYLFGFSMGGLIATNLSIKYNIKNLYLLAPAFFIKNWLAYLTPIVSLFIKYKKDKEPNNNNPINNRYRSYS